MMIQSGGRGRGPNGGSLPAFVMRTGDIAPMSPYDARADITERAVERNTRIPVGMTPGAAQYAGPPIPCGSDALGQPILAFDLPHDAGPEEAQRMAAQLRHLARTARTAGFSLPASAVGAPLAALVAGNTVVLRFRSGTKVSVTA